MVYDMEVLSLQIDTQDELVESVRRLRGHRAVKRADPLLPGRDLVEAVTVRKADLDLVLRALGCMYCDRPVLHGAHAQCEVEARGIDKAMPSTDSQVEQGVREGRGESLLYWIGMALVNQQLTGQYADYARHRIVKFLEGAAPHRRVLPPPTTPAGIAAASEAQVAEPPVWRSADQRTAPAPFIPYSAEGLADGPAAPPPAEDPMAMPIYRIGARYENFQEFLTDVVALQRPYWIEGMWYRPDDPGMCLPEPGPGLEPMVTIGISGQLPLIRASFMRRAHYRVEEV